MVRAVVVALSFVGLVESVAVIDGVASPAAVGVPEIRPEVLMTVPGGRPVAVNVYGAVPPCALTWAL